MVESKTFLCKITIHVVLSVCKIFFVKNTFSIKYFTTHVPQKMFYIPYYHITLNHLHFKIIYNPNIYTV